jgi:FkbM family methyltransferase
MPFIVTNYGLLSVINGASDLITVSLNNYGEWAYAENLVAGTLVDQGIVLWDVGAHLGTFALGVAKIAQLGSVVAIEANQELAESLQANLARNINVPFERVLAGVSARSGFGVIQSVDPSNRGAARFVLSAENEPTDVSAIPAKTLKELRLSYGDYDFLKLDIEGMEVDAIQGDVEFIQRHKPVIWAECNEDRKSLVLLELMLSLGYSLRYVAFPAIRSDNFHGNHELLFPMAYEAALVGATPERLEKLSTAAVADPCIVRIINNKDDLRQALWDTPRWARREWVDLSRPELVARIGRLERRQRLESFIESPVSGASLADFPGGGGPETETRMVSSGKVQVFWTAKDGSEGGFTENASQTTELVVDGNHHFLCFILPTVRRPLRVRIDPFDRIAVVTLMSMSISLPEGEQLWKWERTSESLQGLSGIHTIPADGALNLVCVNGDPQFEVAIPDGIFTQGVETLTLEVELSVRSLENALPQLLKKVQASESNALPVASDMVANLPVGLTRQFIDIAQLMKEQIVRRNATIATQRADLENLKSRGLELEAHVLRAEAQLDLLKEFVFSAYGNNPERL